MYSIASASRCTPAIAKNGAAIVGIFHNAPVRERVADRLHSVSPLLQDAA